jgi:hypothetical protein
VRWLVHNGPELLVPDLFGNCRRIVDIDPTIPDVLSTFARLGSKEANAALMASQKRQRDEPRPPIIVAGLRQLISFES